MQAHFPCGRLSTLAPWHSPRLLARVLKEGVQFWYNDTSTVWLRKRSRKRSSGRPLKFTLLHVSICSKLVRNFSNTLGFVSSCRYASLLNCDIFIQPGTPSKCQMYNNNENWSYFVSDILNILQREIIENNFPFSPEFGRPFFVLGASQDAWTPFWLKACHNPGSELNCKLNPQSEPKYLINPQSAVLVRSANPCKIFAISEQFFLWNPMIRKPIHPPPPHHVTGQSETYKTICLFTPSGICTHCSHGSWCHWCCVLLI
jgi:hypothetical protein